MRNLSKKIEKAPTQKDVQELHDLLKKLKIFSLIDTYVDLSLAEKYVQIVGDIYAFNQTIFWFIKERLMKLNLQTNCGIFTLIRGLQKGKDNAVEKISYKCFASRFGSGDDAQSGVLNNLYGEVLILEHLDFLNSATQAKL